MNVQRIRLLGVLALIQCGIAWVVCANPSHKVLDAPLAIHGQLTVGSWYKEASGLYENARSKLLVYLEKEQKGAIKTISAEDLGKTHNMITMIGRGGSWMQIWGETAGADFALRKSVMHGHTGRIIQSSKQYPATQKYIENFRQFIAKTGPARAKALTNIEKLCNEGKWAAAEERLFGVYDTLEPGTAFLDPSENKIIFEPFAQVHSAINNAMQQLRSAAAEKDLAQQIADLTPKFAEVQQEIQGAVASVATSGAATWRGESATGPQLVEKIAQAWREVQVGAQQCRAKKWAQEFRTRYGEGAYSSLDADSGRRDDGISAPFAAFSGAVRQELVRLVETDGARAPADAVRPLYVEYLRSFAPLVRQANDPQWSGQLQAVLEKLAAKDSALGTEVQSYSAATSDLLRWRTRLATAQLAARETEFPPIESRFHSATLSGTVDGAKYLGLFPEPPTQETHPQLLTDAPDIMPIAIKRLVGQKATVRDVVRISATSKSAIARYRSRTYATIPVPADLSREIGFLKADLLVTDQAPPLSLAAMQAIVTAERGDVIATGGEISGAHLESVVTRFATLPVSAVAISDLGRIPAETFGGSPLNNMMMRFELAPQWACHDYFFTTLTPGANLTAAR